MFKRRGLRLSESACDIQLSMYPQSEVSNSLRKESDMRRLMDDTGVDGVMLARAAWSNPSVFRKEGPLPIKEVIRMFLLELRQFLF